MDELKMAASYERERWGPPRKNKRYERVEDRDIYRSNLAQSNIGKDVNPQLGRRYRKVYSES